MRTVESILVPPHPHFVGDGFRVHNFIPGTVVGGMRRTDPFIMLDYNSEFYFSPTDSPRGVDVHPHKGFETVTIAYKGKVQHQDNSGGGGVIAEGDVQWMTAGAGILHKEFHETEWSRQGGHFQMVQLWVNLPAAHKRTPPKYQNIAKSDIPIVELEGGSTVEVIAGEYNGTKGAASTFSTIHLYNARLKKGTSATFSAHRSLNAACLVVEGSIIISGNAVPTNHFVLFANDGDDIEIQASDDALVLFLAGAPFNEPIAAHGPFVMNTKEEIIEAFEEYRSGAFGTLVAGSNS